MTDARNGRAITIRHYEGTDALTILDDIARMYAEVYQEPPYLEGPSEVAEFVADWPRRVAQPGFRLVVAELAGEYVGFAFGHQLAPGTRWWTGATTTLPEGTTQEFPGRTFAIIELAVRHPYRRMGIARKLHSALLANRTEQRVTLLVRPEAEAAQRAYAAWGYHPIGQIIPGEQAPTYNALVRDLPFDATL
jgi:ribosomal protein S18 acetylase RimI-like enzyme